MKNEIKLGFWNYLHSGILGREAVLDWKEMGFNLPMSFEFDADRYKKEDMIAILDECEKQGMKMIICDFRTRFQVYQQHGEEYYEEKFRQAYDDFGHHPATFGFAVGDEPTKEQWEAAIGSIKVQLRIAPELTPYLNLYPHWPGRDYVEMMGTDDRLEYMKMIDDLIARSKAPIIGYDHYTQCMEEGKNQEGGIDMYFSDLDIYHRVCEKHDIPLYVTQLATGHFWYREPNENDIRWQIYTALAHGARGIFWFYMYQRGVDSNFRNAIYESDFRKTDTYHMISRQQYIFNSSYKAQFDNMKLTNVYHVGRIYEGTTRFHADDKILEVKSQYDYPAIVSYYKEFDSDEVWISIVNAHQQLADKVNVYFKNGVVKSEFLAPGQMILWKYSDILKLGKENE